jgi:hypothetical protein
MCAEALSLPSEPSWFSSIHSCASVYRFAARLDRVEKLRPAPERDFEAGPREKNERTPVLDGCIKDLAEDFVTEDMHGATARDTLRMAAILCICRMEAVLGL